MRFAGCPRFERTRRDLRPAPRCGHTVRWSTMRFPAIAPVRQSVLGTVKFPGEGSRTGRFLGVPAPGRKRCVTDKGSRFSTARCLLFGASLASLVSHSPLLCCLIACRMQRQPNAGFALSNAARRLPPESLSSRLSPKNETVGTNETSETVFFRVVQSGSRRLPLLESVI
jgi:hypothetical protein